MKPHYSKQVLPVPWPFLISWFHGSLQSAVCLQQWIRPEHGSAGKFHGTCKKLRADLIKRMKRFKSLHCSTCLAGMCGIFFQILCEIPRMIGIKLLPWKAKRTSYLFQEDKHSLSIVIRLNTLRKPFEVINQLSKWFAYPFEKNEYPFEWLAYPFEWFAYLLEKFSIRLYDCNIRSNG